MTTSEDGALAAAQYGAMAAAYAAFNAVSSANEHYERPATIGLLGDVAGKVVLEAGCGAGALTEWLVEHGARVTAFDVSQEMLALAAARLGDRATILRADLGEELGFAQTAGFDVVVASLVLHYLRDWDRPLAELRRVVADNGTVVLSTHHPAWDWQEHSPDDYFSLRQVTETWIRDGRPFEVTFWRRPLRDMTRAIADAGFLIDRLVEADPVPELATLRPDDDRQLRSAPFFLHVRLLPRTR